MEWQFRRCVESFENYKNLQGLKNDIDRGKPDVAKCLIRQVQIIINDPNEKIVSKVLALRFTHDIMVLGKIQVINSVEKLIPQLIKICSHRLGESEPDRGQTFFNNHQQYLRGSPDVRKQIETLASTYFTLSIQSIYTWAKWIPIDQNGHESIYSKAYNNLLQRDVIFPTKFHYYKPSDTEKFKNTYKVQFFEESASELTSRFSEVERSERYHSELFQIQTQRFNSVSQMREFTKKLNINQTKSDFLSLEFIYNYLKNTELLKNQQRKWAKNYTQNYEAVVKNQISYGDFIQRINIEQIILQPSVEEYISFSRQNQIGHRKIVGQKTYQNSRIKGQVNTKIQKNTKVQKNNNFDKKQSNIKNEEVVAYYENRIKQMVRTFQNDPQIQIIKQENYRLKSQLQELKQSIPQQQSQLRTLEQQKEVLQNQYQILSSQMRNMVQQNSRLTNLLTLKQKQGNPLEQIVSQLQDQLSKANQKIVQYEHQLKKKQKQFVILQQDLNTHKSQLKLEREVTIQRQNALLKQIQLLKTDKMKIKNQYLQLLGKYDAKTIQQISLKKVIQFEQAKNKQQITYNKQSLKDNSGAKENTSGQYHYQQIQPLIKKLTYNNYNYLMTEFRSSQQRELFIRFCRCCLKQKDLILKQSEIQIGIISEVVAGQKVKFILHLTNISDSQIDNLTVSLPKTLISDELNQFFICCIQPREQEKIVIYGNYKDTNKVNRINITYSKKQQIFYRKIIIPLVNFKFIKSIKPYNLLNQNIYQTTQFRHTRKMLPKPSYITSYFKNVEETNPNKIFQVGIQFYSTPSKLNLKFQFKDQNILKIDVVGNSILDNQTKILVQDLLAFMELVFSK